MVKLTVAYFNPRDMGGLCHQLEVPSMALDAGWLRLGSVGSHVSQIYSNKDAKFKEYFTTVCDQRLVSLASYNYSVNRHNK
jgi:hypothetical protein